MAEPDSSISRRALLLGAGALAGLTLLDACGGGDDGSTKAPDPDRGGGATSTSEAIPERTLVPFFDGPMFPAGQPIRLAYGIADAEGLLALEDTPEQVTISISDLSSTDLAPPVTVTRHANGLARAYFPLTTTVASPGTHRVTMALPDGTRLEGPLRIDDPADLVLLQPGAPLPALQLPTAADPLGVTPICTRTPACPLHEVGGAAALAERRPIALLVATPAFCQVSICGPVLDVLVDAAAAHPGVRFLHAEVYADPDASLDRYAPAMAQLGLQTEPCLFLVDSHGTVAHRRDTIFDADELAAALATLA